MYSDKDSWLSDIKTTAKQFIDRYYAKESSLFEAFWEGFTFNFREISQGISNPVNSPVTEVSFAKGLGPDFVSPVVSLTIAEVLYKMNLENYTSAELEDLIHSAATRHGSKPNLTACLMKNLPTLCMEVQACKKSNTATALVREAPRPSAYRIWTEGKEIVLNSITSYEKDKNRYLLWIDLDAPKQVSPENPKHTLDPRAIQLLRYLINHIGTPKSIESVIKDIYKNDPGSEEGYDKNKIAQHITQLNNFCRGRTKFSNFLFADWRQNGLGLTEDFKNNYFLFKRVAPDVDQLPNARRVQP